MAEYNPTANNPNKSASSASQGTSSAVGAGKAGDESRKSDSLSSGASTDNLRSKGADMAHSARDAAQDYAEKGREYVDRAREMGGEYADRARSEAERLYQTGQQKASDVAHYAGERYDEVSEMVRRNPAQALGIAAGVGFLIGLVLSRR